jgi:4'-phosphopantetheinyl transferase
VAIAAAPQEAIGCDLEVIEPRSRRFVLDYFTDAEAAEVAAASRSDRDLLANLVWSAKESALKALRTGLRRDTRTVEVRVDSVPEEDAWGRLRVDAGRDGGLVGVWRRLPPDLVLTIVGSAPIAPRNPFGPEAETNVAEAE